MVETPKNSRQIVVLTGGIGGGRFLRGLLSALRTDGVDADVTVIGNTGDDITLFGLRVCPDLDTVMYTLGNGIHEAQGWGLSLIHISEPTRRTPISYAVFCLKKKKNK